MVTASEDAEYVRSCMLLPVLDIEKHDVVLVMHSYGGLPGSAAARGLGKKDRDASGKSTAVLGQIFIASILPHGGDEEDVIATLGGQWPPFIDIHVSLTPGKIPEMVSCRWRDSRFCCKQLRLTRCRRRSSVLSAIGPRYHCTVMFPSPLLRLRNCRPLARASNVLLVHVRKPVGTILDFMGGVRTFARKMTKQYLSMYKQLC